MSVKGTTWLLNSTIQSSQTYSIEVALRGERTFLKLLVNSETKYCNDLNLWCNSSNEDNVMCLDSDGVNYYDVCTNGVTDAGMRYMSFIEEPDTYSGGTQQEFETWLSSFATQVSYDFPIPETGTKYNVSQSQMEAIANAIRAKNSSSDQIIFPTGFVDEIDGLQMYNWERKAFSYPSSPINISSKSMQSLGSIGANHRTIRNLKMSCSIANLTPYIKVSGSILELVVYNSSTSAKTLTAGAVEVTYDIV